MEICASVGEIRDGMSRAREKEWRRRRRKPERDREVGLHRGMNVSKATHVAICQSLARLLVH